MGSTLLGASIAIAGMRRAGIDAANAAFTGTIDQAIDGRPSFMCPSGSATGSMRPMTKTNETIPITRMTPAIRNALVKEFVAPTMKPVTTGAATPIKLLTKFMMPPIVPTPPLGTMRDGKDQPTGAAAARPPSAIEIQTIAHMGLVVSVAPNTARPSTMPETSTVLKRGTGEHDALAPLARLFQFGRQAVEPTPAIRIDQPDPASHLVDVGRTVKRVALDETPAEARGHRVRDARLAAARHTHHDDSRYCLVHRSEFLLLR